MSDEYVDVEVEATVLWADDEARVWLRLMTGVLTMEWPCWVGRMPALVCSGRALLPGLVVEIVVAEDTIESREMVRFAVLAGYPVAYA